MFVASILFFQIYELVTNCGKAFEIKHTKIARKDFEEKTESDKNKHLKRKGSARKYLKKKWTKIKKISRITQILKNEDNVT